MRKWTIDLSALLLRVTVGLVFIPHGYSKLFGENGPAAFAQDVTSYGLPSFLGYAAAYAEFFGAILLVVGLLTRLDAFLLACTMFVATFVVQLPDALHDIQPGTIKLFAVMRGIELPVTLFAAALAIMLIGPGRFSLDSLLRVEERVMRRKTKAAAEAAA